MIDASHRAALEAVSTEPTTDDYAAAHRAEGEPRPPVKLTRLDVAEMVATDPPPVPFIAHPVLVRGAVSMLAGREGMGKSMFALALGAAMSHGAELAGIDCKTGRVLVVDAENGQHEAHRRIKGFAVNPERLAYVIADGFNLAADLPLVDTLAREHRPDLVILDSFRSLAPGLEENDSGPVEAILGPLRSFARRHTAAVLLLHHEGKGGGYRGSTAIGAAVELGFTLTREAEDPDPERRKLTCWKCRPAPEPEPRWLALGTVGGYCTIDEAEPFEGASRRPSPALDDAVGDVLVALRKAPGPITQGALLKATGRDAKDSTGRRAIKGLVTSGDIATTDDGLLTPGVSRGVDTPSDTGGVTVSPHPLVVTPDTLTPPGAGHPDTPHPGPAR